MKNKLETLHELCESISEELGDITDKIRKAGGMSAGDLETVDKLTHAMKSIKTTIAMIEAEDDGYSNYMPRYYGGNSYTTESYARGGRMRDAMGRYSRTGEHDHMVMELREAMNMATDSGVRDEIKRLIDKVERM